MLFRDRNDAGKRLAAALAGFADRRPIILALPRGGVPVAGEVAAALKAPLDLVLVRKIGVPFQPELAMGAVVDGPAPLVVRNEDVIRYSGVSAQEFNRISRDELAEIRRRRDRYLGGRPHPVLAGRVAIVVDDGIATGATMRAALRAVRRQKPEKLVMAVPVGAAGTIEELRTETDEVFCLDSPAGFGAIGRFYSDFRQVSDQEVVDILARHPVEPGGPQAG